MDSGLWVLIVLIAGVFGLVGYFVVRESNTNSKKQSNYNTRQYQNSRKTVKENKWSEKLYHNKGMEDSKNHVEKTIEELETLIVKIKDSDVCLFDLLSDDEMKRIENKDYRMGLLLGLGKLVAGRQSKEIVRRYKTSTI